MHFRRAARDGQNSRFRFVKPENKSPVWVTSSRQCWRISSAYDLQRRIDAAAYARQRRAAAGLNDLLSRSTGATSMVMDPMINYQCSVPRARHDDQVRIDLIEELTIASAGALDTTTLG